MLAQGTSKKCSFVPILKLITTMIWEKEEGMNY
jgi:hypothetical protein